MLCPDFKNMSIKSNQEGKENFSICQSKEVWLFSRDHTPVTCFYAGKTSEMLMILAGTFPLRERNSEGDSDLTLLIWVCILRDEGTDCWERNAGHGGHNPCCPHHPAMTGQAVVRWQASPSERAVQSTSGKSTKCFLLSYIKLYLFFFLFENCFF